MYSEMVACLCVTMTFEKRARAALDSNSADNTAPETDNSQGWADSGRVLSAGTLCTVYSSVTKRLYILIPETVTL